MAASQQRVVHFWVSMVCLIYTHQILVHKTYYKMINNPLVWHILFPPSLRNIKYDFMELQYQQIAASQPRTVHSGIPRVCPIYKLNRGPINTLSNVKKPIDLIPCPHRIYGTPWSYSTSKWLRPNQAWCILESPGSGLYAHQFSDQSTHHQMLNSS